MMLLKTGIFSSRAHRGAHSLLACALGNLKKRFNNDLRQAWIVSDLGQGVVCGDRFGRGKLARRKLG
jgi:hypothetical protein